MRCPTCSSLQRFHDPSQGLERRRFPKGRWVCEHELQPWHLQLETAQRELAICTNEVVQNALLFLVARLEAQAFTHRETNPPRPSLPYDRDGAERSASRWSDAALQVKSAAEELHQGNNDMIPTQPAHLLRSA
jgi:hypothetical protein